jgi:GT2 family glycosyltransferase
MLSIIILNYNQADFCRICLSNLKKAQIKLDYEIILVDNNSSNKNKIKLTELKDNFPAVRFIFNSQNLGFAQANNLATAKARGEYILILNPDVIVSPGAIEKLYHFLKKDPLIGVIGPQLLNPDKSIQSSCYRFPKIYTPFVRRTCLGKYPPFKKELRHYLMQDFNHQEIKTVDWLMGACLMFKKEVFLKVKGFDQRYFLYFEDVDFCRQLNQSGYQVVYYPESKMIHFHQRLSAEERSFKALFKKITWIHVISAVKYFWKWKGKNRQN